MSTTIRPGWSYLPDGLGVEGTFHKTYWRVRVTADGRPPGSSEDALSVPAPGVWVSRARGPWHESREKDLLATLRGIEDEPATEGPYTFGAPPFDAYAILNDGMVLDLWIDEESGDMVTVTVSTRSDDPLRELDVGVTVGWPEYHAKIADALRANGYPVVSVHGM